ncbi:MAG: hypothetical protein ABL883_12935 [Terricaulis sp.]
MKRQIALFIALSAALAWAALNAGKLDAWIADAALAFPEIGVVNQVAFVLGFASLFGLPTFASIALSRAEETRILKETSGAIASAERMREEIKIVGERFVDQQKRYFTNAAIVGAIPDMLEVKVSRTFVPSQGATKAPANNVNSILSDFGALSREYAKRLLERTDAAERIKFLGDLVELAAILAPDANQDSELEAAVKKLRARK